MLKLVIQALTKAGLEAVPATQAAHSFRFRLLFPWSIVQRATCFKAILENLQTPFSSRIYKRFSMPSVAVAAFNFNFVRAVFSLLSFPLFTFVSQSFPRRQFVFVSTEEQKTLSKPLGLIYSHLFPHLQKRRPRDQLPRFICFGTADEIIHLRAFYLSL